MANRKDAVLMPSRQMWVGRRFERKGRGPMSAMMMAAPVSLAIWALLLLLIFH